MEGDVVGRCTWTCNEDGTHTVTAYLNCGCEYIDDACIPCLQHGGQR